MRAHVHAERPQERRERTDRYAAVDFDAAPVEVDFTVDHSVRMTIEPEPTRTKAGTRAP